MQPPFPVSQLEPYILKRVLLPTQQSSFIFNLIVSYNKKLSDENQQFKKQFIEKQQKLQRHKQQLKLLPQMKADPQLMNKILEEIELKDYEKQYASILAESQRKPLKLLSKKGEKSIKNSSVDKENCNKTFHVTRRKNIKDFSVDNGNKNTQRDQSLMNVTEGDKKFRSSVIKSSSFSAIKKTKTPFTTKTNINIESIRNSEDVALPQQGLINYFNLKDNKLSEALYGKRPQSKGAGMKRQQGVIKRKNISSLSPEWMHQYAQKQRNISKKNEVLKNDMRDDMKIRFQGEGQQQQKLKKNLGMKQVIVKKEDLQKNEQKNERVSFGQQQQSSKRVMRNEGEGHSKRSYQTKMQEMAGIIQSSSRQDKQQSNPYHIRNFIRQLNSYHINSSKSTHNLGKMSKSRRRVIVEKSGE